MALHGAEAGGDYVVVKLEALAGQSQSKNGNSNKARGGSISTR